MVDTKTLPTRRDAAETSQKKGRSKKDLPQVTGGLLDTRFAAATLGISVRTLQELVAAREIAQIKIGRSARFHHDDLEAFIERNRVKAVGWKGGRA